MGKCPICDMRNIPDEARYCSNPDCLWELERWLGATEEDKEIYRKRVEVARRNYQAAQTKAKGTGTVAAGKKADVQKQAGENKAEKQSEYSANTEVPELKRSIFEYENEFAKRINACPPVLAGEGNFNKDYDIDTVTYPVQVRLLDWSKNLLGKMDKYIIQANPDDALALFQGNGPYPVYALLEAKSKQAVIKNLKLCALGKIFILQKAGRKVVFKTRPKPDPSKVWKELITGIEFVHVPGGKFEMGNLFGFKPPKHEKHEWPVHTVELSGFWIGKYPVTQGEWKEVMGNNPARFQKGDDYPVERVSWNNVQKFIQKLISLNKDKYRFCLPTEAQWEYAARSGGKKEENFEGGNSNAAVVAWHNDNSEGSTHPVGTKEPNGLGIYDMSGNVWEWCEDWYNKDYYSNSPVNNPQGPSWGSQRVMRGGDWCSPARVCRTTYRSSLWPGNISANPGFRLCISPARGH